MAGKSVLVALLARWALLAQAQVFRFQNTPVPATYSLSTHYLFYVYSSNDAPTKGTPKMTFRKLSSRVTGNRKAPHSYRSIQVSILPYDRFWDLVNKDTFCSTANDVRNNHAMEVSQLMLQKPQDVKSLASIGAQTITVPLPKAAAGEDRSFPIPSTGRYILTYSNCGNFSDVVVSGSVAVSNTYGYLPANEYYTMHFFGWLTVTYALVLAVWLASVLRYFKSLFYIQKVVAGIVLLASCEALIAWLMYKDWNATGERRDIFFLVNLVLYTLKYVFSWRLILMASLGAGVVLEDVDFWTSVKFMTASLLFMIQQCVWKFIMSYRWSQNLDAAFLLYVTLPGAIVYAGIFVWTFLALASLIAQLEEEKQEHSAAAFVKTRRVIVFSLLLSSLVLALQVADVASGSLFSWERQWVSVDGAPGIAFLLVLLPMMAIWWPSEDSWKFSYMVQDQEPENGGENIAVMDTIKDDDFEFPKDEEPELVEEDIRSPKQAREVQMKHNAVAPQPIGARDPDEAEGAMLL
mmetsp:Transcript_120569/g.336404  ORF Transcript_120569/g.336404 Transcript_120569/m.336404 type:complete len:520 (+) Transcript_120569:50-1609(+)|eukprot:CAMPEP_0179136046 /NCGR_PEP_ID=MMETSP0796-20121207/64805_1 /TAXON_ID=73915 /ORGANISM="Pyrodinium bahamense, Strain pbaha01" /LENGTH=519 /DNA_ID=CAMNT_0020835099 /DNA_START=35 /DNA_END=1594 /DNA_ORIENTATION=-